MRVLRSKTARLYSDTRQAQRSKLHTVHDVLTYSWFFLRSRVGFRGGDELNLPAPPNTSLQEQVGCLAQARVVGPGAAACEAGPQGVVTRKCYTVGWDASLLGYIIFYCPIPLDHSHYTYLILRQMMWALQSEVSEIDYCHMEYIFIQLPACSKYM